MVDIEQQQRDMFHRFLEAEYQDVGGVIRVAPEQPKTGHTVLFSVCTHGDELLGLNAVAAILDAVYLEQFLDGGEVLFVLNNIHAAHASLSGNPVRYLETDFNRLPTGLDSIPPTGRYGDEMNRAIELAQQIWPLADVGCDLHWALSTTEGVMVENMLNMPDDRTLRGLPFDAILTVHPQLMERKLPTIHYYGNGMFSAVFGAECGLMTDETTVATAILTMVTTMRNAGVMSDINAQALLETISDRFPDLLPTGCRLQETSNYTLLETVYTVTVPLDGQTYDIHPDFTPGGTIREGDPILIAGESGDIVTSPVSGKAVFSPARLDNLQPGELVTFVAEYINELAIEPASAPGVRQGVVLE